MTTFLVLFLATCFLAYSNGANDNFKGVATLFGSSTISYRRALWWATLTTVAGSLSSIYLAQQLISSFSGKGLVPDQIAGSPQFMIAVAAGAGLTVILAALRGLPISTTHSITGALLGSGLVAVGLTVNFHVLGSNFFVPLLVSPVIALVSGALLYYFFHRLPIRSNIVRDYCLCIGEEKKLVPAGQGLLLQPFPAHTVPAITVDSIQNCSRQYQGKFFGIRLQKLIDSMHFVSGGMVCYARGLNDTPKMVALLLAANVLGIRAGITMIAVAMTLGGLLNARKIADTMGRKITTLSHGQGFTANFVTAFLVIIASKWGVPVSTTHVSVGSLFGIGLVTGNGDKSVMSGILLAWFLTLPVAALFAGVCYRLIA